MARCRQARKWRCTTMFSALVHCTQCGLLEQLYFVFWLRTLPNYSAVPVWKGRHKGCASHIRNFLLCERETPSATRIHQKREIDARVVPVLQVDAHGQVWQSMAVPVKATRTTTRTTHFFVFRSALLAHFLGEVESTSGEWQVPWLSWAEVTYQ